MEDVDFEQWIETEDELVFDGARLMNDLLVQKGRLETELAASQNQCQSLERQRDELVAVIGYVEWTNAVDGGLVCPWCGNRYFEGHTSYCPRQAALAAVKGDD